MSFKKLNHTEEESRANRVHSEKLIGPVHSKNELIFKEEDEYIMDVMERTQINV